jgi:peptidoglycan L-alanyl-D-glutamate endopeptidase CwlK
MRDITRCHPRLQRAAKKLVARCKKQGINIKIGECLRTAAEQDKLYSYGRTDMSRGRCTNAKGSTYSSMHQWGIAFDFYLDMDVDHDGKKSDDAFNDDTGLFEKVGEIGKKIGLEWVGGWTSIKDRPHFQLKSWGSTPYLLRRKYGAPEKFMKTWKA